MDRANCTVYADIFSSQYITTLIDGCAEIIDQILTRWHGVNLQGIGRSKKTKKKLKPLVFRDYFRRSKNWFDQTKVTIMVNRFWIPLIDAIHQVVRGYTDHHSSCKSHYILYSDLTIDSLSVLERIKFVDPIYAQNFSLFFRFQKKLNVHCSSLFFLWFHVVVSLRCPHWTAHKESSIAILFKSFRESAAAIQWIFEAADPSECDEIDDVSAQYKRCPRTSCSVLCQIECLWTLPVPQCMYSLIIIRFGHWYTGLVMCAGHLVICPLVRWGVNLWFKSSESTRFSVWSIHRHWIRYQTRNGTNHSIFRIIDSLKMGLIFGRRWYSEYRVILKSAGINSRNHCMRYIVKLIIMDRSDRRVFIMFSTISSMTFHWYILVMVLMLWNMDWVYELYAVLVLVISKCIMYCQKTVTNVEHFLTTYLQHQAQVVRKWTFHS